MLEELKKIREALEINTRKTAFIVRDYRDDKEAKKGVQLGKEALTLLSGVIERLENALKQNEDKLLEPLSDDELKGIRYWCMEHLLDDTVKPVVFLISRLTDKLRHEEEELYSRIYKAMEKTMPLCGEYTHIVLTRAALDAVRS